METRNNWEYRKVQGLVGETSFSIILPKQYAINLGIGKGDFVKVSQDNGKIILEKSTD
jgi:bifunctional DNA-binding transcriptional regulator/antitoxin component of YhaV-PrlF toxin-antitoxin module